MASTSEQGSMFCALRSADGIENPRRLAQLGLNTNLSTETNQMTCTFQSFSASCAFEGVAHNTRPTLIQHTLPGIKHKGRGGLT